jgi:hypothetical protein
MHSWEAPEPRPPRRSLLLWFALVAWFGALYLGYQRLGRNETTADTSRAAEADAPTLAEARARPDLPPIETATGTVAAPAPVTAPAASQSQTATSLPSCESFSSEAKGNDQERVPAHLGRSVLDRFLGDTEWTRPCRGRKRRSTVQFCAAIRDGELVGLTLKSSPKSVGLEECIREQARKVVVRSESVVRIVDITLEL